MADRSVSVRLRMIITDYVGPAETASKATDKLAASLRRAGTAQRENAADVAAAARQLKAAGDDAQKAGTDAKKGADGLKAAGDEAKKAGADAAKGTAGLKAAGEQAEKAGADAAKGAAGLKQAGDGAKAAGADAAKGAQGLKLAGQEAKAAGADAAKGAAGMKAAGTAAAAAGAQASRGGAGWTRLSAVAQRSAATTSAAWKRSVAASSSYTRTLLADASKHEQTYEKAGHAAMVMGGAIALGFGAAVLATAKFDHAMSSVKANADASGASFEALRKVAIKAGADTVFSATEAAQGEDELAKAGVSVSDIIHGGLSGALNLAAAGQISVGEAAETAATAMTQFKLSGQDVPHIADLLSAGANKAQGGVHEMAYALKQGGLIASQFGLSVEDTVGTLTAFASAGLLGQDAGTSFKQMLISIANPSNKAAALMQDLGISAYDAKGQFVGITQFAGILRDRLSKLTPEQRQSALATIFGSDAIRAANILYSQGAGGIQNWINRVNDQGNAARTAGQKMDNLAGDLEQLKGSLETALISGGSGATGIFRGLVQGATSAINAFNRLPPAVQGGLTVLGGISGVTLLAGGALITLVPKIAETVTALKALRTSAIAANLSLGTLGKASLVIAALAGLQATSEGLYKNLERARPPADALTKSLQELGNTQRITQGVSQEWGSSINRSGDALKNFDIAMRIFASNPSAAASFHAVADRVKAMDNSFADLVKNGHPQQAQQAFNFFAQRAQAAHISLEQFRKMFPEYNKALVSSAGASKTAASGLQQTANAASNAAGQVNKTTHELNSYYNEIAGDLTSANLAAVQSLKDVEDTFRKNGNAFHGNSLKALEDRDAVSKAAEAISKYAQKVYDQTGSVDKANAAFKRRRKALIDELTQLTGNRKAATKLADTYLRVPSKKATKWSQPGMKDAQGNTRKLGQYVETLPNGKKIIITAYTAGAREKITGFVHWLNSLDLSRTATIAYVQRGPGKQAYPLGANPHADGAIVRGFANGTEKHVAQVARPGEMRLWAEPETQGEAYIPLAPGKRARSTEILAAVAKTFGYSLVKMALGGLRPAGASTSASAGTTAGAAAAGLSLPGATGPAKDMAALADAATAANDATALLASTTLPAYVKAATGAQPATKVAAIALTDYTTQVASGVTQTDRLTGRITTMATTAVGPGVTSTTALRGSVNALSTAVTRNSGTLAANTGRAQGQRAATASASSALSTHQGRTNADTGAVQRASSALSTNAARIRKTGTDANTARGRVDHFVDAYKQGPYKISRGITVNAKGVFKMTGFDGKFATGGTPGGTVTAGTTETADDVPIWVSKNEYIMRGAAHRKYGTPFMNAINSGQFDPSTPAFAGGGAVSRTIGTSGLDSYTNKQHQMLNHVTDAAVKATAAASAKIIKQVFGAGAALRALQLAETRLGVPYVYGGTNWASGMDCSGLTMMSYKKAGIAIPRTSESQWGAVSHVPLRSAAPGDLVFTEFRSGGPGHVGMRTQYPYGSPRATFNEPHTGAVASYRPISGWTAAGRVPGAHSAGYSGAPGSSKGGVHAGPGKSQAWARAELPELGWGSQYNALNRLWSKESSWHWWAHNPSGAYGIPQALPGSKMASAGGDWHDNAYTQMRWGLGYIKNRYGSPNAAWAHSQRMNWYAKGGRPQANELAWVGEEGPELVRFTGNEQVYDASASRRMAARAQATSRPSLRGFATGTGDDTPDLPLADWLSLYKDANPTATAAQLSAAKSARSKALAAVTKASKDLAAARHKLGPRGNAEGGRVLRNAGTGRTLAEEKAAKALAAARKKLTDVTKTLATVEKKYREGQKTPAQQFAGAVSLGIKNTATWISNLTKLSDRGYSDLALTLLNMGGADAESIAASAVKMTSSQLSGLSKNLTTANAQQQTLTDLPNLFNVRNTLKQNPKADLQALLVATGLPIATLAPLLKGQAADLKKTTQGKSILAEITALGFASGGRPQPGQVAWVGERGPELLAFRGGEQIWSAQASHRIATGFGQALMRDMRQMAPQIAITAAAAAGDGAMAPVINLNHVPGYSTPQEVRRAYGTAVRTARLRRRR